MQSMKWFSFLAVACLLVVADVMPRAQAADVPNAVLEEIVAKVNGDIVTRAELSHTAKEWVNKMKAQGMTGPKLEQARKLLAHVAGMLQKAKR